MNKQQRTVWGRDDYQLHGWCIGSYQYAGAWVLERTKCPKSRMLEVSNSTESRHSLNVYYVTDKRSFPCVEWRAGWSQGQPFTDRGELKLLGFIFTPVYRPDCSSDPQTSYQSYSCCMNGCFSFFYNSFQMVFIVFLCETTRERDQR